MSAVAWLGANRAGVNIPCEVFFVDWQAPPSDADIAILRRLLKGGDTFDESAAGVLVLPRFGLVSPWSSKATDIAARCGLAALRCVERGWWFAGDSAANTAENACDAMTEQLLRGDALGQWRRLFAPPPPNTDAPVAFLAGGEAVLRDENIKRGLALSAADIAHLSTVYQGLQRDPTVAELMMFAQANSEHCRHKIFNSRWQGSGVDESLMAMIRRTHAANPSGVITAFADNAAVIESAGSGDFAAADDGVYRRTGNGVYIVAKAETHNHPTAISPHPGAATGSGGEIRDEAAAGRGATALAGFCGYMVSHLNGFDAPLLPPALPHIATPTAVMTDAPLGAAAFNNEFGRPTIGGFFRSYEAVINNRRLGFHKSVMLAGGIGQMSAGAAGKCDIPVGAKIIQLGGPGFRIGIGGGSASSGAGGADACADFSSVQRANAEMQRRAQMVLEAFRRRSDNPILSLHDVGAGGLANAICELVHASGRGARLSLAALPTGEQGMSAAEIWCNESQERYVLALSPGTEARFAEVCTRERCPWAVLGHATAEEDIVVVGSDDGDMPVNLPLAAVLGDLPIPPRIAEPVQPPSADGASMMVLALADAARKVLRHPSVACKRFLITIGDRTVGGLTVREQMVGPWQTPVADCAAVCDGFDGVSGVAFGLGERAPVAAQNPAAASRLAIAEALLNLAAADVDMRQCKLSLNWMANCGDSQRDGELRAAVVSAADFAIAAGVGVIVGKDSLSMRLPARDGGTPVESPAFAAAFAFAPLADVRRVLTPQLSGSDNTVLLRLDFGDAWRCLGASVAVQCGVFSPMPRCSPDICANALLAGLRALAQCREESLLLSYHDCSDGGACVALCEMAFAANIGLDIFADVMGAAAGETDGAHTDGVLASAAVALFNEAPAVIVEALVTDAARIMDIVATAGSDKLSVQTIARPQLRDKRVRIYGGGSTLLDESLSDLRRVWEAAGVFIANGRDNPDCVESEANRNTDTDGGLFARIPAMPPPFIGTGVRPRVAVLREQGTNGHREMAAAFTRAGFDAVDVMMTDLFAVRVDLRADFSGVALCGGFSFGDVLGAGRGWGESVLNDARLSDMFSAVFADAKKFVFGVCNGCQTLSYLQPLMPAAQQWRFPEFCENESRRFEARLVMAEVLPSNSPLFADMAGLMYPLVVSHGEGRVVFADGDRRAAAATVLRYVDNDGCETVCYPYNPNGSAGGATGFCSPDGRIVALMPHPERVYRSVQMGWLPPQTQGDETPWMQIFNNARRFVN